MAQKSFRWKFIQLSGKEIYIVDHIKDQRYAQKNQDEFNVLTLSNPGVFQKKNVSEKGDKYNNEDDVDHRERISVGFLVNRK